MLIGNQYSDNKLYRGIKYYDHVPLMSEDIHEQLDTSYMKNAYIMDSIVGQGILNDPDIIISDSGISLSKPAAILIHGDVCLVQADNNLVSIEDIASVGINEGIVCIVGWYQHLTASNTLRNYGGVNNSIIDNNLINEEFNIQVSSRYQFRWLPVIIDKESINSGNFSFSIYSRDSQGNITTGDTYITTREKLDNIFIADKPDTLDYAVDDVYIIPLVEYNYIAGVLTSATAATTVSSSKFINSSEKPEGKYPPGTIWFDPNTMEFRIYVEGYGFVDNAATMALLQYQSVYTMQRFGNTPTDILVPIGIEEYTEGDILQVNYEGLILVEGQHYTVQHTDKTITLLQFTVADGERITFNVTKIVRANNITDITSIFTNHMSQTASATDSSHVRLSDSTNSNLNSNNGVAATPKAVSDSKILTDTATNTKYKFGVENGLLYLEEV